MTKANSTELVFVVDRSGSMSSIVDDMRGGFDQLIADQRKIPGECKVTLTQFDNHYDIVYEGRTLDQVPPLELVPRGGTALLDALGRTIDAVGARLSAMKEEDRPSKVLFVVITDGHENASKEYGRERIFDMITKQREQYSWDFVFLGTNQDAVATAQGIGIRGANAMNYAPSGRGAYFASQALSHQVSGYRGDQGRVALDQLQAKYDATEASSSGPQSSRPKKPRH